MLRTGSWPVCSRCRNRCPQIHPLEKLPLFHPPSFHQFLIWFEFFLGWGPKSEGRSVLGDLSRSSKKKIDVDFWSKKWKFWSSVKNGSKSVRFSLFFLGIEAQKRVLRPFELLVNISAIITENWGLCYKKHKRGWRRIPSKKIVSFLVFLLKETRKPPSFFQSFDEI